MILKSSIYVGSIKDTDGIWHPVIASSDEDFVMRHCEKIVEHQTGGFYSEIFTIEIVPIVLIEDYDDSLEDSDNEQEYDHSPDSFLSLENWENLGEEELYDATSGEPLD